MTLYEFPICLVGCGDTPEEAWEDAVEGFTLDAGHLDKYEIIAEEVEDE